MLSNKSLDEFLMPIEYFFQLEQANKCIAELKQFVDALVASGGCMHIGDFGMVLKLAGFDTGPKKIFKTLQEDEYLCYKDGRNYPAEEAIKLGLFTVIPRKYTDKNNNRKSSFTTMINGKGMMYLYNRYVGGANEE